MHTASTRRFTQFPLAAALVAAAGLASGVLALGVTDNLPGQASSATSVQVAPAVFAPTAGEGLVSPRHLEGVLGPGSNLGTTRPMIKVTPSHGQGEGLVSTGLVEGMIGPGSNLAKDRSTITWSPSFGQGEGLVSPGATLNPVVRNGTGHDWADRLPRGETPTDTIRPKTGLRTYPGIGFNPGDVNLSPATLPTTGKYTLDPHSAGVTEY